MWLILLEAFAALLILVGIVWWTMFSGRRRGERRGLSEPVASPDGPQAANADPRASADAPPRPPAA